MTTLRINDGKRADRAFSLLELLITLSLILVMSYMLMNRGSRSRQQRDLLTCRKNLQSIFSALSIYSLDNKGSFPISSDATSSEAPLSQLVPRSTTETGIFICPGTKDPALPQAEAFDQRKISYAYYMGWQTNITAGSPMLSDRQINTNSKPRESAVFSSDGKGPGSNHHKYGGNVLLGDGAAQKSSPRASFDLSFPTNVTLLNPKQ